MLNNRLHEKDSETANMKHEITAMIPQQQNTHMTEMQELYHSMMQQMANMMSLHSQQSILQTQEDHTLAGEPEPNNIVPQHSKKLSEHHQDKRQDTRPSPTKRKPMESLQLVKQVVNLTRSATPQHLEQDLHMDVERISTTIENDV